MRQATIAASLSGSKKCSRPGCTDRYKRQCDAIAAKGYEGFRLSKHKAFVT